MGNFPNVFKFAPLGGSSQDETQVVNNHGDRKSPRPGVVTLPNTLNGFYIGVVRPS